EIVSAATAQIVNEVLRHECLVLVLRLAQHLLDHSGDCLLHEFGSVAQTPGTPLELRHAAIYQHLKERAHLQCRAALTPGPNRPDQRGLGYFIAAARRAPLELRLRPRISRIDCTCVDGAIHVNISVIFSTNISVSTAIAWHGGHRCAWCACRGWHLVHLCIFLASLPPRPRRRLLGLVHQRSLHVLSATRCGYYCTCC